MLLQLLAAPRAACGQHHHAAMSPADHQPHHISAGQRAKVTGTRKLGRCPAETFPAIPCSASQMLVDSGLQQHSPTQSHSLCCGTGRALSRADRGTLQDRGHLMSGGHRLRYLLHSCRA